MALLNVTDMDLTEVEEIISHTFSDKSMLKEALTTAGVPLLCTGARVSLDGNKRLAIIGDAILQLALAEEWYEGNTARENFNQQLQAIGSNNNLDLVGRRHGLHHFMRVNPAQGRVVSPATMATTVEAILGGVWLDSGNNLWQVKSVMSWLGLAFQ